MLVAFNTDIAGIGIVMTTQTIIQIPCSLTFMQSAILGIGPIGIGMISRHDHFTLMTLNAEGAFLMAGKAVILIRPGIDAMIIFIIQRMRQPVQIITFMTGDTI